MTNSVVAVIALELIWLVGNLDHHWTSLLGACVVAFVLCGVTELEEKYKIVDFLVLSVLLFPVVGFVVIFAGLVVVLLLVLVVAVARGKQLGSS